MRANHNVTVGENTTRNRNRLLEAERRKGKQSILKHTAKKCFNEEREKLHRNMANPV